jgi:hypothetical protein
MNIETGTAFSFDGQTFFHIGRQLENFVQSHQLSIARLFTATPISDW